MRITALFLFFLFGIPHTWVVDAQATKDTFIFLPFYRYENNTESQLCRLIPGLMHLFTKNIAAFSSVSPEITGQYLEKCQYTHYDFENMDTLYSIASEFCGDYIVKGMFKAYDDFIEISIETVDVSAKKIIYRSRNLGRGGEYLYSTVSDIIIKIIRGLKQIRGITPVDVSYGFLSITTDYPCIMFVDDEEISHTSFTICFPADMHDIKLVYQSETIRGTVWEGTVDVLHGETISIDKKVFINLDINAEETCQLFLNGRYAGTTPYKGQLLTGKTYEIKAVYVDNANTENTVYERAIHAEKDDISLFLPVTGSIHIQSGENNLKGRINGDVYSDFPVFLDHIPPGNYQISIFLEDMVYKKAWCFYEEEIMLTPGRTQVIDVSSLDVKLLWGLCFIPSAAQYYNREPKKGEMLLSFFFLSAASAAISGIYTYGFYEEYRNRRAAGAKEQSVHYLYQTAIALRHLFYCSVFMTGLCFSISCIDGFHTMNHLYHLFNE
jgi:hypothetical protein